MDNAPETVPSNPGGPFFGRHLVGYLPALIAASVIFLAGFYAVQANRKRFDSEMRLAVAASLDESGRIVLKITDTGIGMSEHDLAKALQPFEQAGGLQSRPREGSGLGLHLCANYMKLFGGGIEIESEVGKGTTVTLAFPPERTVAA